MKVRNFDSEFEGIEGSPVAAGSKLDTTFTLTPSLTCTATGAGAIVAAMRIWFGYLPVAAAGDYTLTWTMSNQFNWAQLMTAVFIPGAAITVRQVTPLGQSIGAAICATFPSAPL